MRFLASIPLLLMVFFKRLSLLPLRTGNWLGDHFQWFRRLEGGTWYNWNGFWQQIDNEGMIYFKRGFQGFDLGEGDWVWNYKQILNVGDSIINAVEDYTKKEVNAT